MLNRRTGGCWQETDVTSVRARAGDRPEGPPDERRPPANAAPLELIIALGSDSSPRTHRHSLEHPGRPGRGRSASPDGHPDLLFRSPLWLARNTLPR